MEASVSVSVDVPIVSTKMRNIADSFLEIILDNESLRILLCDRTSNANKMQ